MRTRIECCTCQAVVTLKGSPTMEKIRWSMRTFKNCTHEDTWIIEEVRD